MSVARRTPSRIGIITSLWTMTSNAPCSAVTLRAGRASSAASCRNRMPSSRRLMGRAFVSVMLYLELRAGLHIEVTPANIIRVDVEVDRIVGGGCRRHLIEQVIDANREIEAATVEI